MTRLVALVLAGAAGFLVWQFITAVRSEYEETRLFEAAKRPV